MANIVDIENAEHYFWGDCCESWILADTGSLSVKQESMPPGTKEQWHFHNLSQQFFYILKGVATFYLDQERFVVTAQKGLLVKPGTKHFIANESNEALEFLVISQPTTTNDRVTIEDDGPMH